jgi:radical SAM superfamily enzyme YgiQ (UPF0313 family)/general stress protein 26
MKIVSGKKYLLINPYIKKKEIYDNSLKLPYALLKIGGYLKKKGNQVILVDADYHKYSEDDLIFKLKYLKNNFGEFDEVWFSLNLTYYWKYTKSVIDIAKKILPNSKFVIGGIYATLASNHALKLGVDEIVQGNIEDAKWSWTDLSLLDYKTHYDILMTSRGCVNRCTYCASHILNKKMEYRNPIDVVDEIEYKVKHYNVKIFEFIDDNILLNFENHLGVILKEIQKRNLKINFSFQNSSDYKLYTPEIIDELIKSGYDTRKLLISYETSDSNILNNFNRRGSNNLEFPKLISSLKTIFKNIYVFLFLGFPNQSIDSIIQDTIFLIYNRIFILYSPFSPIPGTIEFEKMKPLFIEKNLELDDLEPMKFKFYEDDYAKELQLLKQLFLTRYLNLKDFLSIKTSSKLINKIKSEIESYYPTIYKKKAFIDFDKILSKFKISMIDENLKFVKKFIQNSHSTTIANSYDNYPFSKSNTIYFRENIFYSFGKINDNQIKQIKKNNYVTINSIDSKDGSNLIFYARAYFYKNSFLKSYFWILDDERFSMGLDVSDNNICLILYDVSQIKLFKPDLDKEFNLMGPYPKVIS